MDIQHNWDINQSSMFFWDENTKSLECTLGEKPKTLDEIYEEQRQEADYYRSISLSHPLLKEGEYENFD